MTIVKKKRYSYYEIMYFLLHLFLKYFVLQTITKYAKVDEK